MFYHQRNTSYETHTRVVVGTNCIEQLPDEIKAYGCKKILVVTDSNVSKTEFYANCIRYIEEGKFPYTEWKEAEEEAPLRNVDEVCEIIKKNNCNLIVAIGGGSVIDICKLAGVLAANGGKGPEWAGYEKYSTPPVTLFTIPTTAGTSSEVTNMAVLHDEERNVKFTVGHRVFGAASVTFLDGNSIASCPRGLIACCGIDALSHSFESYIALKANPITEALSLSGIRLISRNLRAVYGNSENRQAALDLITGSAMGGLAFNNTGCGNMHCIGRHVGPHFHVNHGMSIAMVMPSVAKFNFPAQMEKYRSIADAMDLDTRGARIADIGEVVVEGLKKLISDVGITMKMSDFNPSREDLETIAQDSYEQYRKFYHYRNPVKMTLKDYMTILEDCCK
ncbi:MAG: iron-containing alcohol dehydrogenase [Synergistaceae bacterium]|nr:iron-containing alcohol dehydrogenase [Synergistaceae bacterium]